MFELHQTNRSADIKQALSNRETFPATAFISDVRVVKFKNHAKAFCYEIYFRTIEKTQAFLGYHNFDTVIFENNIIFLSNLYPASGGAQRSSARLEITRSGGFAA